MSDRLDEIKISNYISYLFKLYFSTALDTHTEYTDSEHMNISQYTHLAKKSHKIKGH